MNKSYKKYIKELYKKIQLFLCAIIIFFKNIYKRQKKN